ncbi:MAG: hypothetical protein ACOY3I_04680 [Verrucomicrobiota bacterium]
MKKTAAIFSLIILLGLILFFLTPTLKEPALEKMDMEEIQPETVATLNPLLTFALQGSESQGLESWNKASVGLYARVKDSFVKIRSKDAPERMRGLGVLIQEGLVLTTAKNLDKTKDIEVVHADGMASPASFVSNHAEAGVAILRSENATLARAAEIGEGMQGGEFILLAQWDAALDDVKMNPSFVSARPADKSLVFYHPGEEDEVFLFNAQGKLIGARGKIESNGRKDYLTLAGGKLSQWVKAAMPPHPEALPAP